MAEVMTVDQIAEVLLCDKETVAEKLNRGELPGLKFGRSWIVPVASFYQRLNELAIEKADARRLGEQPVVSEPPRKRGRPRFTPS